MARNTAAMPEGGVPSVKESARWKPRIIEKCRGGLSGVAMAGIRGRERASDRESVANILKQPFRGDLVAQAGGARAFVDPRRDRVELRALQVAALRPADLVVGGAPRMPPVEDIGEKDEIAGKRHAVGALARALRRGGPPRPRQVLVAHREVRAPHRRRPIAEANVQLDALQARDIRRPP